jgi:membrane associated rhomboid family serine protease
VFVHVPERRKLRLRWATPLIVAAMTVIAAHEARLSVADTQAFLSSWGVIPQNVVDPGQSWQSRLLPLLTGLFVHIDLAHLLGNVLFLLLFGLAVEKVFRSRLVLMLFIACGVLANFAAAVLLSKSGTPIVGASGAVSGLIGAYLYLFPSASLGIVLPLGLYFHFTRVPASVLIGLWFFLQLLYTFTDSSSVSDTAWLAHVIGFVAGWLLSMLLKPLLYSNARARILN